MAGQIYKNLYLCKSSIIFITVLAIISSGICIATTALGSATPSFNISEYTFLFAICYYFIYFTGGISLTTLFTCDERATWVSFSYSTPGSARCQVLSKYYTMLLINVWITFICYISDSIVGVICPGGSVLTAIYDIFVITVLYNAVTMPFLIRFGGDKGLATAGIALGSVVFAVMVYFLFGDISFLYVDDPMGVIMELLTSEGMLFITAILPYISLLLYYLSYRISLKIYRKGAEDYGQ